MHHPTDRIAHTTAFVTPVVEHWLEREIAQRVHSMKDRSDDPSYHERTLLPRCIVESCGVTIHLMCFSMRLTIGREPLGLFKKNIYMLIYSLLKGAWTSAHGAMNCWIDPSWWTHWAISHPSQYFMTCINKDHGMFYPVCGMVHIKEPLLLIRKNSPFSGGSGFHLSLVVLHHLSDATWL